MKVLEDNRSTPVARHSRRLPSGGRRPVRRSGIAAVAAAPLLVLLFAAGEARAQQTPQGQDQDPGQRQAQGQARLDSLIVQGNVRQPTAVITAEAGLHMGATITYRDVASAIRRLMATGQFRDVQVQQPVFSDPADPAGVVLTIIVEEQPFVGEIAFRGLETVRGTAVRDSVGLRAGAPLQPARVAAAEHLTRKMLADKGFMVKRLEHRLEELEGRPGEYRLIFDVDEGQRVALAEIEFEGNQAFSSEQLRKAMGTKREGFLWFRSGSYDEEKVRTDLRERLPEFYGSFGYIDFAIVGDQLTVDPVSGKARLVIHVQEGPQYRLAEFEVIGNSRFPASELTRYFERERGGLLSNLGLGGGGSGLPTGGDTFDQTAFFGATHRVEQLYRNQGYLYSRVTPVVDRVTLADGSPAVHATWQIQEGPPAYINKVTIVGNTKTHESVIRDRIFVIPGDVYNEELLIQSYQSIMGLGFFESPLPMPKMDQTGDGDVDITFEVVEKQTGSIGFGTSIGGGGGLAGFLSYEEPNLFGQAKSGSMRWEFGRWSNNFEASYADPSIRDSRFSGSISVFRARDRFFQFAEGQRRRTGAGLRFGVPLPTSDFRTRATFGYTLSRTEYEQFSESASDVFGQPPGVQSTFSLGLVRNTLNSPIFPTAGVRHEIEAAFSGGPLGGDANFQKYTAAGSWWVPVGQVGGSSPGSRPIRFALGLSADGGVILGNRESLDRFPFERFWMGGIQFGRPLRGYDETTITPRGYIARGTPGVALQDRLGDAYMRLSAEYAVRFTDMFSASAFFDAGSVWRSPREINPLRLARGAGVGVMLVTPFGPLGLDYGYGFDKDRPGWQLHFRFGPGL
jgi:outer membrane protein insertion porin family